MKFIEGLLARFRHPAELAPADDNHERQERTDWMDRRGFRLCLDPLRGRLVAGFDRDKAYEFMREEWESSVVLRLADMHPLSNLWGLRFRPINRT